MSPQGLARHGMASSSTALHSTASTGTAEHSTASHGTAEHSTAECGTAKSSMHGAALCSTALHGTAEPGTAECSTASHGTAESGSTHSKTGSTHSGKSADKLMQMECTEHSKVIDNAMLQAPAHATEAEVRAWHYECNKANTELQAKVNKLQETINCLSADGHAAEH